MYRMTPTLREAAQYYMALQSRKTHPKGHSVASTSSAWYPDHPLPCCETIRRPSRAYPWSLMTHCRSMVHVAAERKIDVSRLRWAVRRLEAEAT